MVQQLANNQFVVNTSNAIYFQSYNSVVCKIDKTTWKITLSTHWCYSVTTAKYLYRFLDEYTALGHLNKKELQNLIAKGAISVIITPSIRMEI